MRDNELLPDGSSPDLQRLSTYPVDFFQKQLGTAPPKVLWKHRCSLALRVRGQLRTEERAVGGLSNQRQPKAWRPGGSKAQILSNVHEVGFTCSKGKTNILLMACCLVTPRLIRVPSSLHRKYTMSP